MTRAPLEGERLWSLSCELAPRDEAAWLELADHASFVLVTRGEREGALVLGLGEAACLRASGEARFTALAAAHRALVLEAACEGELGPLGGLVATFEHTLDAGPTAHLSFPEVAIVQRGGRAHAIVCGLSRAPARGEMARALEAGLARLRELEPPRAGPTPPRRLELEGDHASRAAFERAVDAALEHIARGELEKVVLSRSVRVPLGEAPSRATLLRALGRAAPSSTLYLASHAGGVVLGASPELLVGVRVVGAPGTEPRVLVESEAVAGSTRDAPSGDVEGALLESEKDGREHASVVAFVAGALARECATVELGARRVRAAGPVRHLVTPVTATGDASTSVLSLAAALHPTPALAGAPREVATRLLGSLEGEPRGLYGGLVGVVSPEGHGALYVAIRGLELRPGEARLRAGAGVVRASTAAREGDETTAKLETALGALREALAQHHAARPARARASSAEPDARVVERAAVTRQPVGPPTFGAPIFGVPTFGAPTVETSTSRAPTPPTSAESNGSSERTTGARASLERGEGGAEPA